MSSEQRKYFSIPQTELAMKSVHYSTELANIKVKGQGTSLRCAKLEGKKELIKQLLEEYGESTYYTLPWSVSFYNSTLTTVKDTKKAIKLRLKNYTKEKITPENNQPPLPKLSLMESLSCIFTNRIKR